MEIVLQALEPKILGCFMLSYILHRNFCSLSPISAKPGKIPKDIKGGIQYEFKYVNVVVLR